MSRTAWRLAAIGLLVVTIHTSLSSQSQNVTGRLGLIWGDPVDTAGEAQFLVYLYSDGGVPARLVFAAGAQPPEAELLRMNGRLVTATGVTAAPGPTGTSDSQRVMLVRQLDWVQAAQAEEAAPISGAQPWVTLLCRFGDSTSVSRPVNTSLLIGTSFPSLDEYWRETSYNAINLTGSAVNTWVNLPQPRSYYVYDINGDGTEDADLGRLATDCTATSDPFVNFANFVGVNMMFNQSIGGFWWGGGRSMSLDGVSKVWRTTWIGLPGFSAFLAGLAHETGHGFGLPHSSGPYGQVYDSKWDVMSSSYIHYDSALGDYIPQGTISYHKDLDGWIPANRRFVSLRNTSVTVALERLVTPISSGTYLMAKIPIPGSSTRFYTVEMRQLVGHDAWLPGTAVVLHDVVTNRAGGSPALVVDPDNNGNPNDAGAMWTAGETFTDATYGIKVKVISLNATSATVTITNGTPSLSLRPGDFDGDGKTDLGIFRPSTGQWFIRQSSTLTPVTLVWGGGTDKPAPGDYDGDGLADIAVFRPSTGEWFVRQSSTLTLVTLVWGGGTDIPVQADYDGDGKTDIAVFRPMTGEWFVRQSSTLTLVTLIWGGGTDIPVHGDYDGDGKTDIAVFRPATGEWFVRQSTTLTLVTLIWGGGTDKPVAGDYDGDGKFDIAVFRPTTGEWFVRQSTTLTLVTLIWGGGADIPVPGDYDGDTKFDIVVFRPSTGEWFVRQSSTLTLVTLIWGGGSDIPILKRP